MMIMVVSCWWYDDHGDGDDGIKLEWLYDDDDGMTMIVWCWWCNDDDMMME